MADLEDRPVVTDKPKKSQLLGERELSRDEKLKNYVVGPPCNCSKLKCFEITSVEDRDRVIGYFNSLKTKDEQDAFLESLISVHPVERRRSRKEDPQQAEFHKSSFKYHFNILRDGRSCKVDVCV